MVIRIAGLQHVGHVARMDEICMPRRLMYNATRSTKESGKTMHEMERKSGKDTRMLGIRSWWATAVDQGEWRELLRRPGVTKLCP